MSLFDKLFSEKSDTSIMRIMAVTSLIIGAVLAFKGHNECVGVFVCAAFTGKVAQRFIESKEK